MDTQPLHATRFSVLDRALVRRGDSPAQTLRETVDFAQRVEELGYHRFWVAEHHGVPGVAGSAPTVLAAAVAGATSRIRVGTGGVMLPNHRPLVVAEQFGVLESLFPGRIDMGLGRSVGFTEPVRRALGVGKAAADEFGAQLDDLLGYFAGSRPVSALPATGLRVPAFVLATGAGAEIAAKHGLPLVLAQLADASRMREAIDRYRTAFRPSAWNAEPYLLVAVNVALAATHAQARLVQLSEAWATARSRIQGVFPPLEPPAEIDSRQLTERERRYVDQARATQLHGTEAEVGPELAALIARTGADEILVTLSAHDASARWDSYRRLARLAGLAPPTGGAGWRRSGRPAE